jgi:glycosyltransferase involved in cell wall biosynthesis
MKKVLFIDMHRKDRSPSQRFRYEQYVDLLKKNDFKIDHSFLLSKWDDQFFYRSGNYLIKGWILLKSIGKRFRDVARSNRYDFIFIQREAFMLGTAFFERLLAQSKAKFIFDFDDAIWINQISSSAPNKKLNFLKNPSKTSKIIQLANVVVAGNSYLADYAFQFNKNVIIIPTTIDTDIYKPEKRSDKKTITIGWSGSKTTIDHFQEAIPALERIKNKYKSDVEIVVIGDDSYQSTKLGIKGKPWKLVSEIEDLSHFDIGIMPLPNDEWANGKCGLKALQYMALEIPTIVSPVGINTIIIDHEINGFLAADENEWFTCLEKLIQDESLRKKIGAQGRMKVVKNYSVLSNGSTFLSLFDRESINNNAVDK